MAPRGGPWVYHSQTPTCLKILTIWKDVRVYQRNIYEKFTLPRVHLVKGVMQEYPVSCVGVPVRCQHISSPPEPIIFFPEDSLAPLSTVFSTPHPPRYVVNISESREHRHLREDFNPSTFELVRNIPG